MTNILKNKTLYKYLGIYCLVSILTLITFQFASKGAYWKLFDTLMMPIISLVSFLVSFLLIFKHWLFAILTLASLLCLVGTIVLLKKSTALSNKLALGSWFLFSIGSSVLAILISSQ